MVRISTTAAAVATALCDLTYQLLMTIIIQPQVQIAPVRGCEGLVTVQISFLKCD